MGQASACGRSATRGKVQSAPTFAARRGAAIDVPESEQELRTATDEDDDEDEDENDDENDDEDGGG